MTTPTAITSEERQARKHHRCDTCLKVIYPKSRYRHSSIADMGTVYSYKEHQICLAAAREMVYQENYNTLSGSFPDADALIEWCEDNQGTNPVARDFMEHLEAPDRGALR